MSRVCLFQVVVLARGEVSLQGRWTQKRQIRAPFCFCVLCTALNSFGPAAWLVFLNLARLSIDIPTPHSNTQTHQVPIFGLKLLVCVLVPAQRPDAHDYVIPTPVHSPVPIPEIDLPPLAEPTTHIHIPIPRSIPEYC